MAASATDYFKKVGKPGSATTLAAPGYTTGGTSITVASTTNWPTGTGVTFAIDVATIVGGSEQQTAGTYTLWNGVVTSATTIGSMTLHADSPNSDQNYAAGSLTRVYIPVSSGHTNTLMDGILVHADQDGTLKAGAVDVTAVIADGVITRPKLATSFGSEFTTGWNTADLPAVSTVTANGNRSYDITFASSVASTLSSGMRLRTTRTVPAPTQCTSLNGTTQYWSKATPNKLTFTDDFVVSAWVKQSAYSVSGTIIASRYNGTSGWALYTNPSGQVVLQGFNAGAANYSLVTSHQSIPLNKWVHIAVQLDMSAFTATTTTSYVMLDGKDVPAFVSRGGTNPTALVQAGNLEIGSWNGGLIPFSGKIAQIAIYNAKVTQATILASINQGLSGSETSIASAYSFNGVATDLNTTTPNDLTANGAATATNADSPFGNGATSSTLDYALVMSVSGSTATVQVPEGCTIPTSGGVASAAYSVQGSPYGWVSNKERWTVEMRNRNTTVQNTPVANTWYNLTQTSGVTGGHVLTIPVGDWVVGYKAALYGTTTTAATAASPFITLSTANNSESDTEFTQRIYSAIGGSTTANAMSVVADNRPLTLSSATPYYLNVKTDIANQATVQLFSINNTAVIYAKPAVL